MISEAAKNGHAEVVEFLIKCNFSVNLQDNLGMTGLHYSVYYGFKEIFIKLIAIQDIDIELPNQLGQTPLWIAAKRGDEIMIDMLLNIHARSDTKDRLEWSPLHAIAWYGHLKAMKRIIRSVNILNCRSKIGATPLYYAAKENHVDCVKELVLAGANVEDPTYAGLIPLHMAILNNNEEIVSLLVNSVPTSVCVVENNGVPLLFFAIMYSGVSIISVLLLYGAKIDSNHTKMIDGTLMSMSPLLMAIIRGQLDIVQLLVKKPYCADINFKSDSQSSPLWQACAEGHQDIVEFLISEGALLETENVEISEILIATNEGWINIIILLMRKYQEIDMIFSLAWKKTLLLKSIGHQAVFEYFYRIKFFCDLDEYSIYEIYIELFNHGDHDIVKFLLREDHLDQLVNFSEKLIFHESFEESLKSYLKDEVDSNFEGFKNILSVSFLVFQWSFLENPPKTKLSNFIRICYCSKILGNLEESIDFCKQTAEIVQILIPDDNILNELFEDITNMEAQLEEQKISRSLPDDLLFRLGILDEVSDTHERDASIDERRSVAAKIIERLVESLQANSVDEDSPSDKHTENFPNI